MKISVDSIDQNRLGVLYGTASYVLWGLLPLYWKLVETVPHIQVLGHRIFWSFVFMVIIVVITGGWKTIVAIAANRRKLLLMFLCGIIISLNWYVYIYAINTDQVIEASMGYFINPLVVVLLGVLVFKEKLSKWQITALVLAAAGVLLVALQYARFPWIALALAGTFATYGLIKKIIMVHPITGLTLETLIVSPIALFYLLSLEVAGTGAMGSSGWGLVLLLAGTGAVTSTPLLLYAKGIENTTFSMMGFLQYIAPSINLFLGVVVFREYFSLYHFLSFCLIWAGLAIFTLSNLGILRETATVSSDWRNEET